MTRRFGGVAALLLPAQAQSSGITTATIPVTPPVRSVTVSPNAVTYANGTNRGVNLTFPNDTCTAAPAVMVANTGSPGHVDVHGADAVPSDNGGCTPTANQSTSETLNLVGPASSTDPSGQFATTITWTAVP